MVLVRIFVVVCCCWYYVLGWLVWICCRFFVIMVNWVWYFGIVWKNIVVCWSCLDSCCGFCVGYWFFDIFFMICYVVLDVLDRWFSGNCWYCCGVCLVFWISCWYVVGRLWVYLFCFVGWCCCLLCESDWDWLILVLSSDRYCKWWRYWLVCSGKVGFCVWSRLWLWCFFWFWFICYSCFGFRLCVDFFRYVVDCCWCVWYWWWLFLCDMVVLVGFVDCVGGILGCCLVRDVG